MFLQMLQALADADYWQLIATVIKALTYGASFASAGGVIFVVLFSVLINAQESCAIRQFVRQASIIAIVLSVARIAVTNGMLSGQIAGMVDLSMTRIVLASSEGLATGLRCLGLLLIVAMIPKKASGFTRNISLLGTLITATSFVWVGHAGELKTTLPVAPQLLLFLHLLGVAFWIGALWPLHLLTKFESEKLGLIAESFGRYAVFIVGLLVAVGAALLWMLAMSSEHLFSTAYGQLFLLKLMSMVFLLAGAGLNKLWLTPQLLLGNRSAIKRLSISINVEMVFVAVILLMTASFTTIVGPT